MIKLQTNQLLQNYAGHFLTFNKLLNDFRFDFNKLLKSYTVLTILTIFDVKNK